MVTGVPGNRRDASFALATIHGLMRCLRAHCNHGGDDAIMSDLGPLKATLPTMSTSTDLPAWRNEAHSKAFKGGLYS